MIRSMRQTRTLIMLLVGAMALAVFSVIVGVSPARAANSYEILTFSCDGAYNSGSFDNAKNLYIPCGTSTNSTIYKVAGGNKEAVTAQLTFNVSDVAPSPNGNFLYVARGKETPKRLNKQVDGTYEVDPTWKLAPYSTPADGTISEPTGKFIDVDGNGNIYLAEGGWSKNLTHNVIKYSSNGDHITNFGGRKDTWDPGFFYWQLNGLAVSRDGGKIYTVEGGNNRVQRFDRQADGSYVSKSQFGSNAINDGNRLGGCNYAGWSSKFASPYDIALDGAGNLYVINTTCREVVKFQNNQQYVLSSGDMGGGDLPHGFAVAYNGDVYIGQSGKWLRNTTAGGDTTEPTVGSVAPQSGATGVAISTNATATFSEAMDVSTVNGSTFTLKKEGAASPVAAGVSYDATTKKATLKPSSDLKAGATYTATVKGGASGVKDAAGNPLAQDKVWSFTTAASTPVAACDKWASVSGNDANPGTQAAPYLRVAKLIRSLAPGETGCLKAGETFEEPAGEFIIKDAGGTQGNPITIRSSGTPRAKIKAGIHLQATTHDIVFRDLNFVDSYVTAWDGSPYMAPDRSVMLNIQGDRIELRNNDLSFKRGHCVNAGNLNGEGGVATDPTEGFVLDGNRIHNCGTDLATFNESGGEHGVYLTYTTGARITNNYIYDNHVRGLQLYPKAEGTRVEYNVLDGNSQNLNIGSYQSAGHFSRDTTVKNNIITNSALQHPDDKAQVHGFYPAGTSDTQYNNIISGNCIYQQDPTKNFSGIGYTQTNNIFSDPLYKDRTTKTFALQDGSPCAGKGPQTGGNASAPTVGSVTPQDGTTATFSINVTATFSEAMDASTVNGSTFTLKKEGAASAVAAGVTYNSTAKKATLNPNADLAAGTVYTATVKGGANGVKDVAGSPLAQDKTWSFRTAHPDCINNPTQRGDDKDETLRGTENWDAIAGMGGNDTITDLDVSDGRGDIACGGEGYDTFSKFGDFTYINGGPGADVVDFSWVTDTYGDGQGTSVQLNNDNQETRVTYFSGGRIGGLEMVIYDVSDVNGSRFEDGISGNDSNNYIEGNAGDDRISGDLGNDLLVGGPGADTINGGDGNDTIRAQDGVKDTIDCGAGTADTVYADPVDTTTNCETVNKPPNPDTTAPNTAITSGPSGTVRSTTASFSFYSSEAGSRFECSLDWRAFSACSSLKSYTNLANGTHTFRVRAIDRAGNVDASPAKRRWSVDTIRPTISKVSPKRFTRDRTPTIKAKIKDNQTNLSKRNIKLVVNGKKVPKRKYSYSRSRDRLSYTLRPKQPRGKRVSVKIVVRDKAGNVERKRWRFKVR